MPTAAVKTESNGIPEGSDPLHKLQKNILQRIAKLEQEKLDLDNDAAHPKGTFYKKLAHDQITYKKLNSDQMNHLREMDVVYANLQSLKEIAEVIKNHINDYRAQAKKMQKKASQEKAKDNLERVKDVLRVQLAMQVVCEHPELFSGPTKRKQYPKIDAEMVEKLSRVQKSITPPDPTDSDKSLKELVTPAAQHIHLLIDGRKKFVTKALTYQAVKDLIQGSVNNHCYFVEKKAPEPVAEADDNQQQQQQAEEEPSQVEEEQAISVEGTPDLASAELAPESEVSETTTEIAAPVLAGDHLMDNKDSPATSPDFMVAAPPSDLTNSFPATASGLYDAAVSATMDQKHQNISSLPLDQQQPAPPPGLPHPSQHVMSPVTGPVHPSYYHPHHPMEQPLEQPPQPIQMEEEQKVLQNVSITELITRGTFDFLQDSVIDMANPTPPPQSIHQQPPAPQQPPQPSAATAAVPSVVPVETAAVYMDPAVVSIGSVNNGSGDLSSTNATIASVEKQRFLQQHSNTPPPLSTIQPPPSFPAATSIAQPSSHEQYFSQSPAAAAAAPYSGGPQTAAPPPPAAAPVDITPNPPPPIPMPPQEHSVPATSNNWPRDSPSENWGDDNRHSDNWGDDNTTSSHRLNNGTTNSSNSPSVDVDNKTNKNGSNSWSSSNDSRYHHHHSSKSWAMQQSEPETTTNSMNWGDEMSSDNNMHWDDSQHSRGDHNRMMPSNRVGDDFDRKNRGGPRHRRMDDDDEYESNVFGGNDYDDRNRSGVYRRGGRGGRMNGGGFRGRGSFNYQNGGGRGGYGGGGSGFRGGRGGGGNGGLNSGGSYRGGGMRNNPNNNRNGMPRGNGGGNGSAFRNSRNNYNNQRPFYSQQQQQQQQQH